MEPEENSDVYHQKKTSAKQRLIPGSKNTRLEGGNATPYGVLRKTACYPTRNTTIHSLRVLHTPE